MSWYSRALSRAMAARPARSSARVKSAGSNRRPAQDRASSAPSVRPRARSGRTRPSRVGAGGGSGRRWSPARRAAGRSPRTSGARQPVPAGGLVVVGGRVARRIGRDAQASSVRHGRPCPARVTAARSARNGTARRTTSRAVIVRVQRVGQDAADLGQEGEPAVGLLGRRPLGPLLGQRDALLRLPPDLLGHAVQVDEHPHLGPQDFRHDRGEDVVHGPQRVALGGATSSAKAVRKMIGVWADRLPLRISAAVSKPSMPGMLTSSRMTAKSCCSTCRSASAPDRADDEVLAQLLQDRLVDEELFRQVVDDQDVGLIGVRHGSSDLSSRRSEPTRLAVIGMVRYWSTSIGRTGAARPAARPASARDPPAWTGSPSPGLDALLAVALHGLGRHRDDRQVLQVRESCGSPASSRCRPSRAS